jgi:hypothetical protein
MMILRANMEMNQSLRLKTLKELEMITRIMVMEAKDTENSYNERMGKMVADQSEKLAKFRMKNSLP